MSYSSNIHFVTRGEIDVVKWNSCIDRSSNGLIYGYHFYLDHMAKHWDALVLNDYEAVMPLTWNSKFGIHYLYQPFLAAQLGVFGNEVSRELLEAFLQSIPVKFKYWDISLNQGNPLAIEEFELYPRTNYVLDLSKDYDELYKGFSENIQRNIKKAIQASCRVEKNFDVEKVIDLAVRQMKSHSKESGENVERFRKLFDHLQQQQKAVTYGIFSAKNELWASAVFFYSHNRAYYILVGNHPNGKSAGSSHALVDAFIRDHDGKPLLLDFEGSDIPNLAFFYSSFGSKAEKYAGLKVNRLPFYLKWTKRV